MVSLVCVGVGREVLRDLCELGWVIRVLFCAGLRLIGGSGVFLGLQMVFFGEVFVFLGVSLSVGLMAVRDGVYVSAAL